MDDENLTLVEGADAHRLLRTRCQRVRPVQSPGAELVAVEVAGAHVQQGSPELVLARLGILLDEPDVLEGAQQSMPGALGKAELAGEIDDTEPARAPRKQPQDRCGALDGLNVARHLSSLPRGSYSASAATLTNRVSVC